jgi:FKBP-type peptidyl-prolyl cis-trans isomerase FkpA
MTGDLLMSQLKFVLAIAAASVILSGCSSPAEPPVQASEPALSGPPAELVMQTLQPGDGEAISSGSIAVVHYTGWLYDQDAPDNKGMQFDTSRPRPFSFPLGEGRVIRGWDQGVEGMRIGEHRRLVIPPDLAYGDRGAGGGRIPPGATLVFDVELLGIE